MSQRVSDTILQAVECLKKGGVIAYPTEAVFGLGCDPFNQKAVTKILKLKQRPVEKGLILVGANWEQLEPLVDPINPQQLSRVFDTWPGPYTWVFPASPKTPHWLTGQFKSLAIRISAHPVVHSLCELYGGPIVSTSANVAGYPPIRDARTLKITFEKDVDCIVEGKVGTLSHPTQIRDAITGEIIR